jgi:hypothetical protein
MPLAVQTGKKMPDVSVNELVERLAVCKCDELFEVSPIGRKRMYGVTTVDFEVFKPSRYRVIWVWQRWWG